MSLVFLLDRRRALATHSKCRWKTMQTGLWLLCFMIAGADRDILISIRIENNARPISSICIDSTVLTPNAAQFYDNHLPTSRRWFRKKTHSFLWCVWKGTQQQKINYGALRQKKNRSHSLYLRLVFQPRIVSRKPTHETCIIWIINEHDYFDAFDTREKSLFLIFVQRKDDFLAFNQLHVPTE